jgi:hypothetical protein
MDINVFNCKGGNFGYENTAKRVCDSGVQTDEREGRIEWLVGMNLDLETLFHVSQNGLV